MYHLIIPSAVKKDIKKFDKNILEHIEKALNIILKDPLVGEKLKGDMKEYYSYHLKVRNVQYRIIY